MVDIVTRLGKGSPLTNAEVDANFTSLAEVSGVTGEPMGHEDRTTSTISFNASTRTFTIAPVASSFTVWCKGKKVVVSSAQTVTIPNTTGMYSIYYDANGVLSAKSGYFTFSLEAPTAYVYWNAATGTAPYFGDERHGVVLDWQTHEYLHRTRGAALASGFSASGYVLGGNGSSNSHAQITLEGGTFFDEDMKIIVTATNTPTAGTWEQDLLSPARIPVLYLSGTGWVIDAPTDYPLKQGTARPQYNAYSGGVWSTADVANNKYATSWILATNNLTYPVIAIIGQAESDLQSAAEAVDFTALQLPGFPSVEFRPLYKLIFQCADSCTNAVHASLVSITDIRSIAAAGTAASLVTDHGNLSGLSDDDHPQYIHVDTLRTVSAAVKASFLPSQTSNTGKFLQTDGTATSWQALTSSNVTTALGFTPYNATNPSGYISGITSGMVTTALGFTPYNATNPSGYVSAAGARGAISVTGAGSYDSATGVINIVGGVTSFNTRTGAITLSSADVTTALGFTPYNSNNPNGYLTSSVLAGYLSFTGGGTVTAATTFNGGITVRDSIDGTNTVGSNFNFLTNRNGNQTLNIATADLIAGTDKYVFIGTGSASHVSSTTTVELGASTPGSITRIWSPLEIGGNTAIHAGNKDSYTYPPASHTHSYLPLTGGTLSGALAISSNIATPLSLSRTTAANSNMLFGSTAYSTYVGLGSANGELRVGTSADLQGSGNIVLHSGNYSSYAAASSHTHSYLPLSGGTLTGTLFFANATSPNTNYIQFGDNTGWALRFMTNVSGTPTERFKFTDGGAFNSVGAITQNGNQVLHAGNYGSYALPLSGGTVTGQITGGLAAGSQGLDFAVNDNYASMRVIRNNSAGPNNRDGMYIGYQNSNSGLTRIFGGGAGSGGIQISGSGVNDVTIAGSVALNAGNYSSYALPLAGGTLTGTLTVNTNDGVSAIYGGTDGQTWLRGWGIESNRSAVYLRPTANGTATLNVGFSSGSQNWGTINLDTTNLYKSGNVVLHAGNYSSYALPLTGGTLTGTLGLAGTATNGFYAGTGDGADYTTHNFRLHGWNGMGFYNPTSGGAYPNAVSGYIDFRNGIIDMKGGFKVNGSVVLHAGNYTSYRGTQLTSPNGATVVAADSAMPDAGHSFIHTLGLGPSGNDGHILGMTWASTTSVYGAQIWLDTDPTNRMAIRSRSGTGVWNSFSEVLTAGNYNSYAPTLTGGGASGTWGINITGSAGSVSGFKSFGSIYINPNGANANCTTAQFMTHLSNLGFFNYAYSVGKCAWDYAGNNDLTDTGFGTVDMAGCVIETWINGSEKHVRVTRPTTGAGGFQVLVYIDHGSSYSPGWRAMMTSENIGSFALPIGGGDMSGRIRMGTFTSSQNNTGEAWIGRASDRATGTMTVQLGNSADRVFEVVDNPWTTVIFNAGMNSFLYKGSAILHAGNYTSYSPSLGGSGASGTWGINITGNAGSATTDGKTSATTVPASTAFSKWLFATSSTGGTLDWNHSSNTIPGVGTSLLLGTATNGPGGGNYYHPFNIEYSGINGTGNVTQMAVAYGSPGNELYMRGSYSGSWNGWNRFLNSSNYNSYSPTLTGGNASGTWGISISGSAAQLGGYGPNQTGGANTIVQRDGNGYIQNSYFYTSGGGSERGSSGIGYFAGFNSSDYYFRSYTAQAAASLLSGTTMNIAGNAATATRAAGNFYIDSNYGRGIVGVYSSYRYQGVFAMGDSYKLADDGTTTGSLYGMAWSHYNAGGAAGNLTDHGLLIINNGAFKCAISNSIVASANITAYSDERLKTNWRDMPENYVARLAQVKVGIYDRTDQEDVTQVGVSAQSFQKLLPQAIMKAKDEMGTLSVSYGNAALASAVELAKDNVELRARIERLESLINKLIGD